MTEELGARVGEAADGQVGGVWPLSCKSYQVCDCPWVPGSFEIFLLGTRVLQPGRWEWSRDDGNTAATGNPVFQPPSFPSRAVLEAFPALTDVSLTIPKAWNQSLPSSFILSWCLY